MRKVLAALPLAALASACVIYTGDGPSSSAASRGPDQSRDYALSGFSKVDASAGVSVILAQGPYAVHAQSTRGDLSNLKLIDSSGLGALISLYKQARSNGGTVSFVGVADQPLVLFKLLKLDRVFALS